MGVEEDSAAGLALPPAVLQPTNAASPAKMRTESNRSPYRLFTALILLRGPALHPSANSLISDNEPTPIIVVEALRKSLRTGSTTVDILRGLDFTVERGEFVAIMGASGSGKSTLLGLLAGLDNPSFRQRAMAGNGDKLSAGERAGAASRQERSASSFRAIN